ncbi:ABC transporter permease [Micromonospora sp. NPDC049151]|uniref:ABC transporter permease n=1 Tax=Micromonospora sp. NPDC049151 TaxID=3155648 RepID=UPI0033FD6A4D
MRLEFRKRSLHSAFDVRLARFKLADFIFESTFSVIRFPGRSLITAVGTILGAAAFVATLGIGSTMGRQVSSSFDVRRATAVRVVPQVKDLDSSWQDAERLAGLRSLNGVVAAGGRSILSEQTIQRALGSPPVGVQVVGADPGAIAVVGPRILAGRAFDNFHESRRVPVVMLASPVAEKLGIDRVGVGVFINDRSFTVIGIYKDVTRQPEMMSAAVVPMSVADEMALTGRPPERDVIIETRAGAAQIVGAQATLSIRPQAPTELRSVAPPDPKTLRLEIEGNVKTSSIMLSGVALVVGAVSIANAAAASISSRTPEIGLRRAIGARPVHILGQLLGETTALGVLGGLVGVAVGSVAVCFVAWLNHWLPVLDIQAAILAVISSGGVGLIAGLIPGLRAMRIQPVAALQR